MTNEFQQSLSLILLLERGGVAVTCSNKHVMNPDQRWASLGRSGTLKMEKIKEL